MRIAAGFGVGVGVDIPLGRVSVAYLFGFLLLVYVRRSVLHKSFLVKLTWAMGRSKALRRVTTTVTSTIDLSTRFFFKKKKVVHASFCYGSPFFKNKCGAGEKTSGHVRQCATPTDIL